MSLWKTLERRGWMLGLALALGLLALDAGQRHREFGALRNPSGWPGPAPERDAASPTGYQWGQRDTPLTSADGYHWVMQTQRMIAEGTPRIRHVDYDGGPAGREVHWSSPPRWWLAGVAWVESRRSGAPWALAVERVAPWASAWLLGGIVLALALIFARRLGALATTVLVVGLVGVLPLAAEFEVGSIDHHGIAAVCGLLTTVCLVVGGAGWVRREAAKKIGPGPGAVRDADGAADGTAVGTGAEAPSLKQARGWFVASGIAGGVGLWISASTLLPVIVAIGAGAAVVAIFQGRAAASAVRGRGAAAPAEAIFVGELWRWWGRAGGAASGLFYLVEYFPSHLGWRLEVNHPLYALAWCAGGELLARLAAPASVPTRSGARRRMGAMTLCAALVVAPAATALFVPGAFVVGDRFLWRLHVETIEEFAPLFSGVPFSRAGLRQLVVNINLLPLLALPVAAWWLRGRLSAVAKSVVWIAGGPAAAAFGMACRQQHWISLSAALWLALLAAVVWLRARGEVRGGWRSGVVLGAFAAAVLLPYPTQMLARVCAAPFSASEKRAPTAADARQFAVRDLARWFVRQLGGERATILAGPTATTELIYHGGLNGVGSLYWENLTGLRASAEMFSARTEDEARALVQRYGVTHIVFISWSGFAEDAGRWLSGGVAAARTEAGAESFLNAVARGQEFMPAWLRPLFYRWPDDGYLRQHHVLVLEVRPDQTVELAHTRHADYLALMDIFGPQAGAAALLDHVLERQPDYLPALISRARLGLKRKDERFFADLRRIETLLPTAAPMEIVDEIRLGTVLSETGDPGVARLRLARAWQRADARELRALQRAALGWLLKLTFVFGLSDDEAPPVKQALVQGLYEDYVSWGYPFPAGR